MKLVFDEPVCPANEVTMIATAFREITVLQRAIEGLARNLLTQGEVDSLPPTTVHFEFNYGNAGAAPFTCAPEYDGDHLISITVTSLPDKLDS